MKLLAIAALLALQPQAGRAQATEEAPTDALAETLISILPDRGEIEKVSPPDPELLDFLNGLNPGKAPQVTAVLEDFQICLAPAASEGVKRMFRKAARSIGPAKTQRMIDFYRLDRATMQGLLERLRGPAPSAADKAEEARLNADYPLREYFDAYQRAVAEADGDSVFIAAATRCAEARDAALARAGLRSE